MRHLYDITCYIEYNEYKDCIATFPRDQTTEIFYRANFKVTYGLM